MSGADFVLWATAAVALSVGVIGVLSLLTAQQIWRAEHNRAVFELFDERYSIYQQLRDIASLVKTGQADREMFASATEALEKSQFLFGQDVVSYIRRFAENIGNLECVASEIRRVQGSEIKANLAEQKRLKEEINGFFVDGTDLFSRYIRFDQKVS
jgi:hypothetical protein